MCGSCQMNSLFCIISFPGGQKMKRKVLVVDDNELNRDLLHKILQDEYDVLEADNGKKAIDIMKQISEELSAVLLDIVMPELNGYEVLEQMRSCDLTSNIPVIVATGNTESGAEVKALALGANDYISKPYNPEIIRHRLINTINLREKAAIVNAIQTDALTGLYSRNAFFEKANEMIMKHEAGYYVIASYDVENFKVINDQYGNKKGDEVLRGIADVFRSGFEKGGGICARITADDFAVLYPQSFSQSEEIKSIRKRASILDGSLKPTTFSIGRYIVEDLSLPVSAMYDRASIAKRSVKGRFDEHVAVYDESMRNRIIQEQRIISEMKTALADNQFEAWYQPQYNHSTGAITGAEALVRWRHPEWGLVSPGAFIPIFEKNGFVYEVDKFVWEQVCILLRRWIDEGRTPNPISVNISRYDIFREDLVEVISRLIKKYELPVALLRLEITESAFSKSSNQIIKIVKEFKKLGFTMEIDDFGSGYSSLNTLKDVPADIVKLDMRFLEGEENLGRGGNIIESIVRMTKWLGMSVIAEGVETVAQADFLKTIGCDIIQGYLYAKPMPVQDYEALIEKSELEPSMPIADTAEAIAIDAFWNPNSLETLIFNSFVGAACVFELYKGQVEILRVNDKYAKLLGSNVMSASEARKIDYTDYVSEDEKKRAISLLSEAVHKDKEVVDRMTLIDFPNLGENMCIQATMRMIAHAGERYLFYSMLEEVTDHAEICHGAGCRDNK